MIWMQIAIMLLVIFLGTRLQGIGLGVMGGMGLAFFTFMLHIPPTQPPMDVLMIVTTVVTASGALEAAGGLRYLTLLAEKLIRKYPHSITFISPFVAYVFTFLGGTGHTVYSVLPVIADVARDVGVRPSRPLSMAVIAAQQAVIASPISAPTVLIVGLLAPYGIGPMTILQVCVPATLSGVLLATLVVNRLGKALHEDPVYLQKMATVKPERFQAVGEESLPDTARRSVGVFLCGIIFIVLLGTWQGLRPSWEVKGVTQPLTMAYAIAMVMLSIAASLVLLCRLNTKDIVKSHVFTSGIQAVISILGITWLGDTFIAANKTTLLSVAQQHIMAAPWQFGLLLFFMSMILVSQAATVRAIMPLGITLGLSGTTLLAALPAVSGVFFIPNYPTILAAINLDSTGTTRVGRFILNHSFMVPGLVATVTACAVARVMVRFVGG